MIAIAPTHQSWFNQLRSHPHGGIVNFWTPTPWNVRQLKPGDLFYFLLKAPIRKIGGFGHFVGYENMRASEARRRFGADNGVLAFEELVARTGELVDKNTRLGRQGPDPEIGCILLSGVEFASEADWVAPSAVGLSFPRQVVKLKYFPKLLAISTLTPLPGSRSVSLDKAISSTIASEDGQGFATDAAIRKAIEQRAMRLAKEHYGPQFVTVEDTSTRESYDLRCTRLGLEVHVEVKGSTGTGKEVFITAGELANAAKAQWRTDLFVVSSIALNTDESGTSGQGERLESSKAGTRSPLILPQPSFDIVSPASDSSNWFSGRWANIARIRRSIPELPKDPAELGLLDVRAVRGSKYFFA